jgi:hypothetical protein
MYGLCEWKMIIPIGMETIEGTFFCKLEDPFKRNYDKVVRHNPGQHTDTNGSSFVEYSKNKTLVRRPLTFVGVPLSSLIIWGVCC